MLKTDAGSIDHVVIGTNIVELGQWGWDNYRQNFNANESLQIYIGKLVKFHLYAVNGSESWTKTNYLVQGNEFEIDTSK